MKIPLLILSFTCFSLLSSGQNALNPVLVHLLDSVLVNDQLFRSKTDSIAQKFGWESVEMQMNSQKMYAMDTLNTLKVSEILDKHGWLGSEIVGERGNSALFLVIQHSNLKTQEKYLPLMKDAAHNGKLLKSELALLIDRMEMANHRPQIYGSQIQLIEGKFVIYMILDEANVNIRRSEVGLEPLEEYVKNWKIDYKLPTK